MVICVMNRKGGTGKTAVSVNLSAIYASKYIKKDEKVLLIDVDPQANATTYLDCYDSNQKCVYDVIRNDVSMDDIVIQTKVQGLYMAPSFITLDDADMFLNCVPMGREYYLKKKLTDVRKEYKYIFIDCPPSKNYLTINALAASDYAIMPCEATEYGMDSIEAMSNFIPEICTGINSELKVAGIVFCKREKTAVQAYYEEVIRNNVSFPIFKTTIRKATAVERSLNSHLPLIDYDKKNPVTLEYLELAKELFEIMHG